MRIGLLSPLALALLAGFSLPAQASSDDSCYPDWRVSRDGYEPCSNQPFLSPGNDSRVNLRLLLADKKAAPLAPNALGEDDLAQGFGPVPFPVYRLVPVPATAEEPDNKADDSRTAELDTLLQPLGIKREEYKTAGQAFLNGEGSRCRSNDDDSATAFISQVIKAQMPPAERDVLVKARLQLLTTCDWSRQVVDAQLTPSANAQLFRTYLQAAGDFYSGRFDYAERGFAAASTSDVPWLKETALYMTARTSLNQAQAEAFDEYGMPQREHVDKSALSDAEEGFLSYLKHYPQGDYVASARGLLRRVHWLANDDAKLAEDFTWQFTEATDAQRNVSVDELVEEADLKLLMVGNKAANSPMLQVVSDLMAMRAHTPPLLSREDLDKQKSTFANEPALFDFLQASYAL